MRGQTPLAFRTLLHGPKKTGAWRGGHMNAAELTEGRTTGLLPCFSWSWVRYLTDCFQGVSSSFGPGFSEYAIAPPFVNGPWHLLVILPPTTPLKYTGC